MRALLLAGAAMVVASGSAYAAPQPAVVTASLFSPLAPAGSVLTKILLSSVSPVPSQTTITTPTYTVTFGGGITSQQGVVLGTIPSSIHATPVAGISGVTPLYLSGDYGSSLVTGPSVGNYFSTGLGTITITFATPQTSLALLWGSIDASNSITFSNGDVLTGAEVQTAAAGFTSNGFQGPTGSAYVALTDKPFTTATFSSGVVSFEFDAVVGSNTPFVASPEPVSLAVLGAGLLGLGLVRRRNV